MLFSKSQRPTFLYIWSLELLNSEQTVKSIWTIYSNSIIVVVTLFFIEEKYFEKIWRLSKWLIRKINSAKCGLCHEAKMENRRFAHNFNGLQNVGTLELNYTSRKYYRYLLSNRSYRSFKNYHMKPEFFVRIIIDLTLLTGC